MHQLLQRLGYPLIGKKKKESKLSDALYYWKIKPVHLGD
jgi:hypothetical protein